MKWHISFLKFLLWKIITILDYCKILLLALVAYILINTKMLILFYFLNFILEANIWGEWMTYISRGYLSPFVHISSTIYFELQRLC